MISFLTTLGHPATYPDYPRQWGLLTDTVASLLAQNDPAFEIVVVCRQALDSSDDPRLRVVELDWAPPTPATATLYGTGPATLARAASRAVGIAEVRDLDATHVMFCAAGDLLAADIAEFVNARPAASGWELDRGYEVTSRGYREVDAPEADATPIVRFDLLESVIPSGLDRGWPIELVAAVVDDTIGLEILGNQQLLAEWLRTQREALDPYPQRSVVWNFSRRRFAPRRAGSLRHDPDGGAEPTFPPPDRFDIPVHRAPKQALAVEGIALLRASRMTEARAHWQAYWERALQDEAFAGPPQPQIAPKDPHQSRFRQVAPISDPTARSGGSVCVYTALFGAYDELRPPLHRPPGIDFICFSDRPNPASGWDVRLVDPAVEHSGLQSRKVKILAHDYVADYDFSLYVDANIWLAGDVSRLVSRWLGDKPFVTWPHPGRSSVYDESEAILAQLKHTPGPIIDQYELFLREGVPPNTGIIEASLLWRAHHDPQVRNLMTLWWDHVAQFGPRDQPGLSRAMWRTGVHPEILPPTLGDSRNNEFCIRLRHSRTMVDIERERSRAPAPSHERGRRRGHSRRPLTLNWIYSDSSDTAASTLMRGRQLSQMAKAHLGDAAQVGFEHESRIAELRDSIVFLTKGVLKRVSPEQLQNLRDAGNVVCADYVDGAIRHDLAEVVDVYIASSVRQFSALCRNSGPDLVHLISHHADPRLEDVEAPTDRSRLGYFGEIPNARYVADLNDVVDFCQVNTFVPETEWTAQIRSYNVHYAVRRQRRIDRFKPFTKGFTAAQCHANIIVPAGESDALFYLGSDYPYLLHDDSLSSVTAAVDHVNESFGGPEWNHGLEIMADVRERCSPAQVVRELDGLLAVLSE